MLDDLSTGHADAVPEGATLAQASLHDSAPVLADVRPEAVLHFAAKSLVGVSQQQPEDYWHTNVGGSLALLEAMRAADCRRIVFSSTAATYGEPEQVPIREDAPTRPTNTYGASKLAVDAMLTSYAVAHGFAAVSLRYFNVAGAAFGLGERHATETHLIPIALQVAAGAAGVAHRLRRGLPDPRRHLHPRLRARRATSPTPTCSRCPPRPPASTASTTWATAPASRCRRSWTPSARSPGTRCRSWSASAGPATRRSWSPRATGSAPTSAGRRGTPTWPASSATPGRSPGRAA